MRHHAAHLNFTWDTTDVDVGSDNFTGWQEHFAVCRPIKMSWILCVPVLHLERGIFPVMSGETLTYLFRDLLLVLLLVCGDSHRSQISYLIEHRIDIRKFLLAADGEPPKLSFKAFGTLRARGYL